MKSKTDLTTLYGSDIVATSDTLVPYQNTATSPLYSQPSSTITAAPLHYASSVTNEWRTPARYMDAVREVLGGRIELDAASCEEANKVVRAQRFYTVLENGLAQPWNASTVFLNPPYGRIEGKSQAGVWSQRLIAEYNAGNVREAVLLVNSCTSEQWFQPLYDYPICFSNHRIRFYGHEGRSPTKGSAFVYFGMDTARFARAFSDHRIGRVLAPMNFSTAALPESHSGTEECCLTGETVEQQ